MTMLTKIQIEGHPPGKKLVGGNQHGRLALLKSRTVGSSHELNAKHDGAAGEPKSVVAASATGTVVGLHPSLILHHQQQQQQHASPPPPLRSKVKTNGHLIPYMQQQQQQVAHHSVKSRGPLQLSLSLSTLNSTELLIKITSKLIHYTTKGPIHGKGGRKKKLETKTKTTIPLTDTMAMSLHEIFLNLCHAFLIDWGGR